MGQPRPGRPFGITLGSEFLSVGREEVPRIPGFDIGRGKPVRPYKGLADPDLVIARESQ